MRILEDTSGQMTVEMAVVVPAMMALLGIMVNLMVFLGDCARFDRIAPEAIRVYAASPGYGEYSAESRAGAVRSALEEAFPHQSNLDIQVSVRTRGSSQDGEVDLFGTVVSFLAGTETYTCVLNYRPWGFGDSFFGVSFSGIRHSQSYVISPFRPGVLL